MKQSRRKNQSGQMVVEAVLLMSVLLGGIYFVGNEMRSRNFIAQLVSGPWLSLAGMIQNGVWGAPSDTTVQHPNSFHRVSTPEGDPAL
jgi:hypothetical protein